MEVEKAARELNVRLREHAEWFCAEEERAALAPGDWTLTAGRGRMHFSYWGERGLQTWRVASWHINDKQIILRVTRPAGPEVLPPSQHETLTLTPRVSVREEIKMLRAARLAALARFVHLTRQSFPRAIVLRASLSRNVRSGLLPGREARVIFRQPNGDHVALTGLADAGEIRARTAALLSSALLWFGRLAKTISYRHLFIVCAPAAGDSSEELLRLIALLGDRLRRVIQVYEIGGERDTFARRTSFDRNQLFAAAPRLSLAAASSRANASSAWIERVRALAPHAVDVVRARHGETLRFHGLPFARFRRVMNEERAWFGVAPARRVALTEDTWPELVKLIESLIQHRRADATDRRHAFFAAAGEAWLESLLRRDITRLDPHLIASPLHAQLRAAHRGHSGKAPLRPIDLCGLRHDNRLVLIELKVVADRELVFQGLDYWWRVETLRRRGALDRAALFGAGREIADLPPLLYLAAPLLSFHPAFAELAAAVDPHVEIYRFDLNEDWRAGVRVARRSRVN